MVIWLCPVGHTNNEKQQGKLQLLLTSFDRLEAALNETAALTCSRNAYQHGNLVPFLSTLLGHITLEAMSKGNFVVQETFITCTLQNC